MKLNKNMQYALLITLYLCRSGRASASSISEGLDLSYDLVQNVSAKLRRNKVIKSVRGPGGGFELVGDPTVQQVFDAIQPIEIISKRDRMDFWLGRNEDKALLQLASNMRLALNPVLNRKVRNVGMEVVAADTARLNRPSPSRQVN